MADEVNRIKNPDFTLGKEGPRWWVLTAEGRDVRWQRAPLREATVPGGMRIETEAEVASALWSQGVRCKPGKYYRVEATVSCDLTARSEDGGCVLVVEPIEDDQPTGDRLTTPGLHRAFDPVAIRARYRVPDGIRRLKVSVGLTDARGTATIHHVRVIEMLEPDEASHPIAIPPPPYAYPAPLVAADVCVCSRTAESRPITRLLQECYGRRHVHELLPADLKADGPRGDVLLLPDPSAPPAVRSLKVLLKLAAKRVVVVSLSAFAKLAGEQVKVRRIAQDDDPIHAKVMYGHFATRGFALHDVFPYAARGEEIGSFVQNQFRKTADFKRFREKHGFVTVLNSMCDKDSTSDQPICLYKETEGGGLFVLDIEPAEADASTLAEPTLAMHLLLSVLGREQGSLGQYVAPFETEAKVRENLREMAARFADFFVYDEDLPADEVTEQVVTIGREDQSFGPPLEPKPLIVVRSGLVPGDVSSFYGALLWFKQLVRMEPYRCPYREQLASQFRLMWVPLAARWEWNVGFACSGGGMSRRTTPEEAGAAVLVDVVSASTNNARVVVPSAEGSYASYQSWLPRLTAAFPAGRYFAPAVAEGESFADREDIAWRHLPQAVEVVVDATAFDGEPYQEVFGRGGQVIRLEVPNNAADFSAQSIHRTDLTATSLEQVIGLQYGLIAVNRHRTAVRFDSFPPVAAGQALIVPVDDPMLRAGAVQAG